MKDDRWRFGVAFAALVGAAASANAADATKVARCGAYTFALSDTASPLPHIALAAGARRGDFLLDYGTTQSSLNSDAASRKPPRTVTAVQASFNLPTFSSGRFLLRPAIATGDGRGVRAGVVGTDFLSLLTADFMFGPRGGDVVFGEIPCDGETLRADGMVPVRQTGFFSSDQARVRETSPNVPVLYLKFGPVAAVAQIDTGYDDGVHPPSIDINEALFFELQRRGVAMQKSGSVVVATCAGDETRDAFRLSDHDVDVRSDTGELIRTLTGVTLIAKRANRCGGIASMHHPAAQLGFAALRQIGRIVFDPRAEVVWVARR